ncbi:hypothetical protein GGG16DRAFT_68334, partial [Schizophyllum commune]
ILRRLFADPEPPGACAGSLGEGSDEGRVPSLPFLCHKRRSPTLRDRFWRDRTAGCARALNDSCEEGGILSDLSKDRGTLIPCKMSFCCASAAEACGGIPRSGMRRGWGTPPSAISLRIFSERL